MSNRDIFVLFYVSSVYRQYYLFIVGFIPNALCCFFPAFSSLIIEYTLCFIFNYVSVCLILFVAQVNCSHCINEFL